MANTYAQRFLTIEERFWQKVAKGISPESCWHWQGTIDQDGYSRFWVGSRTNNSRRSLLAHRLAYEWLIGPIPPKLTIDHLCNTRNCVNPAHMRPVPIGDNVLRGNSIQGQNKRKTHCKRGHPLKGRFLQVVRRGRYIERHCRECKRLWMAEHRAYLRSLSL